MMKFISSGVELGQRSMLSFRVLSSIRYLLQKFNLFEPCRTD